MPAKALTTEDFIKRATEVHKGFYNYTQVVYKTMKDKVKILCSIHGIFDQQPLAHLKGQGCSACHSTKIKKKTGDFIREGTLYHSGKYDYSRSVYVGAKEKITIICPIHGQFYQTRAQHLRSEGCNSCRLYGDKTKRQYYIDKATEVHRGKYNYSQLPDKLMEQSKVTLICPKHGEFVQNFKSHITGKGCPFCGIDNSAKAKYKDKAHFIERAISVHGEVYDYSLVKYTKAKNKVDIICKTHGVFSQAASKHMAGDGCPSCAVDNTRHTNKSFIELSNKIHDHKYNYSLVEYTDNKTEVNIICPKHGVFSQRATSHLEGKGCSKCGGRLSRQEDTIINFITSLGFKVEQSNRTLIKPLELDIVIPEKKVAIEYNGVRWHSEDFGKDKHYHKNKTTLCKEAGYRLIHIWEDDFIANPERELSFIRHTLGCSNNKKVYARKTELKEILNSEGRKFLDKHHIQGSCSATRYIGLFDNDELVSVTAFTHNGARVELTRHAAKHNVVGSLGKTTKYYSNQYKTDIVSFCDLARFSGGSYYKAGYKLDKEIPPDYKYVVGNKREHKFNWRKKNIASKLPDVYDEDLTEKQMMYLAQIPRIWDCGKLRLVYKYNN